MRRGTVSEIQSGPPQRIKSGLPCANSEWVSQRIPSTYYPRRCHLLSNAALVAKATSSFFIIRYCLTTAGLGEISSPTAVVGLDAPRLVAASIRPFADLGRGPFRVRKFTICAIAAHLCHFILLGINDGGGHEWALGQAPVAFTESNTAGGSGMRVGR